MAADRASSRDSPDNDVFLSSDCKADSILDQLQIALETASDFLIYRDFDKCLTQCSSTINTIKSSHMRSSCQHYTDSLCILMIQAYAEMNQWEAVLPFIQDVYGGIELCPVRVIQLCLLLHVKVKEYIRCHSIARLWLQCDHNRKHQGYSEVAKLYVHHILVPLGAFNLIPQFVDSCEGLSDAEKEALLSPAKSPTSAKENIEESLIHGDGIIKEEIQPKQKSCRHIPGLKLLQSVRKISRKLLRRIYGLRVSPACRLVIILTLAAFALVNSLNSDMMTGYGRLMTLMTSFSRLWSITPTNKPG